MRANKSQLIIFATAFLVSSISFRPGLAHADQNSCPKDSTEYYLEEYYRILEDFKKACGRYPTAAEGLRVFVAPRNERKCYFKFEPEKSGTFVFLKNQKDGWGKKFKYTSDGKTFRLEASHGYFVTDHSPMQESGHWENPHPPAKCEYVDETVAMKQFIDSQEQDYEEKLNTEALLDVLFGFFDKFKLACGRYPLTEEGFAAFRTKPPNLNCPNYNIFKGNSPTSRGNKEVTFTDGWKETLKYKSDGKTYRVDASHGYFLTEKSQPNGINNRHWEKSSSPKNGVIK